MRRKRRVFGLLTLAAATALITVACGGSGGSYSAAATRRCLENAGATVRPSGADYIAQGASGGGYLVTINSKTLNVSFASNGGEANDLLNEYETIGGNGPEYRKGNAVLVWDDDPGSDRSTVDGCLR
jgi:hypothetical protein